MVTRGYAGGGGASRVGPLHGSGLGRRICARRFLTITAAFLALAVIACGSPSNDAPSGSGWVGTISTEGNVTTVVNESGSVWGGTARLVEEASIGLEVGADEYMFGEITALHATEDAIYVLDTSAEKVRVYDLAGNHLRSFGRAGQGPGELGQFAFGVSVGPDGRVYVDDLWNRRINIYSREGEAIDEIPLSSQVQGGRLGLVLAEGGGVWVQVRVVDADGQSSRTGVRVHTVDGPVGEPILVPEIEYDRHVIRANGRDIEEVPFAATATWTLAYDESLIVGASDRYRFRIIHPDGRTTVVERFWDPVPVTAEEAGFWRRATLAAFRPADLSWNGENIPDHKPAYFRFQPAASGEIWLMRHGPLPPGTCTLEPEQVVEARDPGDYLRCMYGEIIWDVFDRDGRYLGNVEGLPVVSRPFINGDTVVAVALDDAGTVMVKRYRLVLPGEEGRSP
jgi:hypothetical protein